MCRSICASSSRCFNGRVHDSGASEFPSLFRLEVRSEFDRVQNRLMQDYPVTAELSWAENGAVQVHLKGRLPIYSDIAAVYGNEELAGQAYTLSSG